MGSLKPHNCVMGSVRSVVGIAMLAACGGGTTPPPDAKWDVVAEMQPAALLSVWAESPTNVWVVGGYAGTDGPIVEHYDGTGWTKFQTGLGQIDLWWVTGFSDGLVYMGGSKGTIVSTTDGSAFTPMPRPTNNAVTVFGLWGPTSSDVWAVGGTGASGGFAWHFDGSAWTDVPQVPAAIASAGTLWKVNGRAANDLWMSGTNGVTLHYDGSLTEHDVPQAVEIQDSLFSIDPSSQRVITVGGTQEGILCESTDGGASWTSPLPSLPPLTGVAVSDTEAYAVGAGGAILHRDSGGKWSSEISNVSDHLHAAHIDSSGDAWAVGGNFNVTPTALGVLVHKGVELQGSFQ